MQETLHKFRHYWIGQLGLVAVLAVAGSVCAQEPLVLEHADSTEVFRPSADETEYQLYGDVRFSQGDTHLRGDRAIWRRESGIIQLDGNVVVQQPHR